MMFPLYSHCDGLNENSIHGNTYLNAWSQNNGTLWEGLEVWPCWKKFSTEGRLWGFKIPHHSLLALPDSYQPIKGKALSLNSRPCLLMFCHSPHHECCWLWHSGTIHLKLNAFFYNLSCIFTKQVTKILNKSTSYDVLVPHQIFFHLLYELHFPDSTFSILKYKWTSKNYDH